MTLILVRDLFAHCARQVDYARKRRLLSERLDALIVRPETPRELRESWTNRTRVRRNAWDLAVILLDNMKRGNTR